MPASDLRQLFGMSLANEGVRNLPDLAVTQRAAGANMSVDVAAGSAAIQDDHATGGGFYAYTLATATNYPVGTADPTNPRIDRVVIRVRDAALGDAANDIGPFVVAGTPTAGATLANLNGAASVPGSSLLLANILIPAAGTSVTTANIDTTLYSVRRSVDVLNYSEITSASAITATTEGGSQTVLTTFPITLDGTTTIDVEFNCPQVTHSAVGTNVYIDLFDSGTALGLIGKMGPPLNGAPCHVSRQFTPSAGSHTFKINAFTDTGTATFNGGAGGPGTLMPIYIRIRAV